MAKAEDKAIEVVYLNETVMNPGIQGLKTLSTKDIPGIKFERDGDFTVKYTLAGKPSGLVHFKSIVYAK